MEEFEDVVDDVPMRIIDRVYAGSIDSAMNHSALQAKNIRTVVSLLSEKQILQFTPPPTEVHHVHIVLEDSAEENLLLILPEALYKMNNQLENTEGNVLVHCVAGVSRSISVIAAWIIMTHRERSVSEALDLIRRSRPWAQPNVGFLRQLELFHDLLHDRSVSLRPIDANVHHRIDFAEAFMQDICSGKKTSTLRCISDVESDTNSTLSRIRQFSLVQASCAANAHRSPFGVLFIRSVSSIQYSDLSNHNGIVEEEGFGSLDDLQQSLLHFYPDLQADSWLLLFQFRCIA